MINWIFFIISLEHFQIVPFKQYPYAFFFFNVCVKDVPILLLIIL